MLENAGHRMRNQHDGLVLLLELGDLVQALCLERCVADRENLVHEQDFRLDVSSDRESEANHHAR
jgi:hypothetical protein